MNEYLINLQVMPSTYSVIKAVRPLRWTDARDRRNGKGVYTNLGEWIKLAKSLTCLKP